MNPYLFYALESTPRLIRQAFELIPQNSWDTPTHQGRFTPRQVIAHLLDWEPIIRQRIDQAVKRPGSTLQVWDEGERAIAERYSEWLPNETLTRWQEERALTVTYLQTLDNDAWSSPVLHPERGTLTVADMANMLPCHDIYHLEQLTFAR